MNMCFSEIILKVIFKLNVFEKFEDNHFKEFIYLF